MSSQALAIFEELRALAGDSELVLPGRSNLKHPFAANALNKGPRRSDLPVPPFTIHDLRRSGSTRLHEMGYPSDLIETALNHQIGGVRGVYNRAKYEPRRCEISMKRLDPATLKPTSIGNGEPDYAAMLAPFLDHASLPPEGFESFDHILGRTRELLKGMSADKVARLIDIGEQLSRKKAEPLWNEVARKVAFSAVLNHLTSPLTLPTGCPLCGCWFFYLNEETNKCRIPVLASSAILSLFEGVYGDSFRQQNAISHHLASAPESKTLDQGDRSGWKWGESDSSDMDLPKAFASIQVEWKAFDSRLGDVRCA